MAGTLFGIPLSQPLDINGAPLSGNLLYVYLASTNTPASTFQDFGLTVLNTFPLQADSAGRIPAFWVADGAYRARLTDSAGVMVYDIDNIQAIGPSTGTIGGGGGGVDATAVFQTGDPLWVPVDNVVRSGWIRLNARTFGSASSGGTERANADTQALYEYVWNTFSDTLCPVTGGRGGSATTDFTANKSIASLDMRGIGAFGLDTMGNSAAGRIAAGTTAAVLLGSETSTALLSHTHGVGTLVAATHTHSFSATTSSDGNHSHTIGNAGGTASMSLGGQPVADTTTATTSTAGAHTHTLSGTSGASGTLAISGAMASAGTGSSFSLLQPGRAGTWYWKL